MDIFIGKQPILNNAEQVVAYELLYRNRQFNAFPNINEDQATIDVIINAFVNFGFHNISDSKPVFINFSENLLMNDFIFDLSNHNIVIEILETVQINRPLLQRLTELKQLGFKLALDDFEFDPTSPFNTELFRLIDIIKIDFLNSSPKDRNILEQYIKRFYPHITLLAEKIEKHEEYIQARKNGYTLFQGYFFERPKVLTTKEIQSNTMHYFNIMALLSSDEPDVDEIAETIETDVSLTYKLLKLVNTNNPRIRSNITSIRQAIMILGLLELQKWIYLLAIRLSPAHPTMDELIYISLFRAKVCEMLARQHGLRNYSEYYLVGMFSNIDAILQMNMGDIVKELPFSDTVISSILNHNTEMTPYLHVAIALQKLDFEKLVHLSNELNINLDILETLYYSTNEWVESVLSNNLQAL